jgi:hypothetical protein
MRQHRIPSEVGQESPERNAALGQLEAHVPTLLEDGWIPFGGVSVSLVPGPGTLGSERDDWRVRFSQAMMRAGD